MPQHQPQPASRKGRKLPLLVVLVLLYQLAKVAFFGWVFWQCWQAQGSGIPPFGEVENHNPVFDAPYFLVFPLCAVFHLILVVGLLALGRWARAFAVIPLIGAAFWWFLENSLGYYSLRLPVDTSAILAVLAAEILAIVILYATAEAREAFAPAPLKHRSDNL